MLSRYGHEGANGESSYNSYSFLTSALDGVNGQRHAPPRFTPGKGLPIPIAQKAG
jgi:hypothetical protein